LPRLFLPPLRFFAAAAFWARFKAARLALVNTKAFLAISEQTSALDFNGSTKST